MGVYLFVRVIVLFIFFIKINLLFVNDFLVIFYLGSKVNWCCILYFIFFINFLEVVISMVWLLILCFVCESKLVVINIGLVVLLVSILILEGLVGIFIVIFCKEICCLVVVIYWLFGLKIL